MDIGEIKNFELNHMPSCWIECNGQELNIWIWKFGYIYTTRFTCVQNGNR